MNTRDRGQTPTSASLAAGWTEAVHREGTELKADTASAFYLDGEGTSKDSSNSKESMDTARIISNNNPETIKNLNKNLKKDVINKKIKNKISKRFSYRVPVLYPDGKPGMPTTNKRANKWISEGKAEIVKNKLNIFAIKLKFWPVYRNLQPMVLLIDPGSTFTGIAVMSKRCINISYMLELPGYKKGAKPLIIEKKLKNGEIKKIEKWPNTIVERMESRRILRRGRRHRNCRRREERWLNRSKKGKLAPSMLAKKQFEWETVRTLFGLYPIVKIGFEDVAFNHYKDKDGINGQSFSLVEIGKNWLLDRLKNIPQVKVEMIKGYETSRRREQLGLKKEKDKTVRDVKSHVTDCVAMGSIILGTDINIRNKFKFNVISRPKYTRRVLFAEQPGKGGIFERAGGHIPHHVNGVDIFKGLRKGDYVEARLPLDKKIIRGWISGYTGDRIYVSSYDWEQYPSVSVNNIKLLDRNHGLINLRLSWIKDAEDICQFGTGQIDAEGNKVNMKEIKEMIKMKKKEEKALIKESNKRYNIMTVQKGIDDAWS